MYTTSWILFTGNHKNNYTVAMQVSWLFIWQSTSLFFFISFHSDMDYSQYPLTIFPNCLHHLLFNLSRPWVHQRTLIALTSHSGGLHPHIICPLAQGLHLSSGSFCTCVVGRLGFVFLPLPGEHGCAKDSLASDWPCLLPQDLFCSSCWCMVALHPL